MRQYNKGRRERVLKLRKCLEELAEERRDLLDRLENLDARERAVVLENNTLHNLDALTSNLPDEALAMVFEAGLQPDALRFGELVSHVSRRWRSIALATPNLWTNIRCCHIKGNTPHSSSISGGRFVQEYPWSECKGWEERAAVYFSRSRSLPIDIHIRGLYPQDFTPAFLRLLNDHISRCSKSFFERVPPNIMPWLLELLERQPIPLLRSFALTGLLPGTTVEAKPFPFGAPLLTTAQLGKIQPRYLHHFMPAFASVTSLRLTYIFLEDHEAYNFLRDGLMNLKSLYHLELQLEIFEPLSSPDPLPIVLPTVQVLHVASVDWEDCNSVNRIIARIRAESLKALSLNGWDNYRVEPMETHFPLLKHLVLVNLRHYLPYLAALMEKFPDIERLTFHASTHELERQQPNDFSIKTIMPSILRGISAYELAHEGTPWPELNTIATSACLVPEPRVVAHIPTMIARLQATGQPVRNLLMPRAFLVQAGAEVAKGLQKIGVEIGVYSDDWPMPFAGDRCADQREDPYLAPI
ncbi:hypothetical protein FIBSPDRAFT_1047115 [Athelia psychrophila]|uniref:Uncharacterized protein n=1 Tax=Athelia psychrophila TaxID=1759441 RepID=A0A166FNH8_9AGAM|nr:hypothetical protein FIBSPDRAFT_1047115 [Fibularhizoctonia sp. CBS 109695]